MDNSPHNASWQNSPFEPPDTPDGWRSAEPPAYKDPRRSARLRWRAVQVALAVFALACVIGIPLWNTAAHYARGVHALKSHLYSRAADEFSAAQFLGFSYRDARLLEDSARRAAADVVYEAIRKQTEAALVAQLEKAGARLEAGDADGVLTTLQTINGLDLQAALRSSGTVREFADALAKDLAAASRRALGNGAWGRAGRLAAALLVLDPSSELAATLRARAQTGQELGAKLDRAKDAARRGRWRAALHTALAILAVQKDFPGAAALAAQARAALAPKPKPTAVRSTSLTRPTGGSRTGTVPQPPPPP